MASGSALLVISSVLLLLPMVSKCEHFKAGFEMSEAEVNAAQKGDSATRCPVDFSKLSYKEVTSVCKGPKYEQEQCCAAFKKVACKYPQVNDFSSTCPIEFMAYLNYAGSYPNGVFVGRCNSGTALCS